MSNQFTSRRALRIAVVLSLFILAVGTLAAQEVADDWTSQGSGLIHIRNNNSGNVGIGASTAWSSYDPSNSLEVASKGTGILSPMTLSNTDGTTLSGGGLLFKVGNGSGATSLSGALTSVRRSSTTADLSFRVQSAASTMSEYMRLRAGGMLYLGLTSLTSDPTLQTNGTGAKLYVAGDIYTEGSINAAKYQDLAEWVPAVRGLTPGTIVTLDKASTNRVRASSSAYDTAVAGVVGTKPGILLGEGSPEKAIVATTGRVKVKVDASKGPIFVGDLIVSSDREGYGMRSEPIEVASGIRIHRPGTLVGKALEPLPSGQGEILVLLSLQ